MPKVNVYLPDDLAEVVKKTGVPVSAVCQRALEQAVRRVTAVREVILADAGDAPTGALAHFTARARTVLGLAVERARNAGAPRTATHHLLGAMLDEGANLALHVLRAMEIEPERIGRELARRRSGQQMTALPDGDPRRPDGPAARALELAVTEAAALGHNYIGCEHLLLGLAAEPDGSAGQVLRARGADPKLVRRAVTAALAGYVHLRAEAGADAGADDGQGRPREPADVRDGRAAAVCAELEPLNRRIARLEEHLGLAPEA